MNGAESLVRSLVASGVKVCFANPGTSEIHIVDAIDRSEMRSFLCLSEGVATGAADGYARMAGRPASTLLHLAPGVANGLANLHNASRAQVPIVNIVGDHPASHRRHDTPLNGDIEALAQPYSKWLRRSSCVAELAADATQAVAAARTAPGQIATVIVPADVAWQEGGSEARVCQPSRAPMPTAASVKDAAKALRTGSRVAILLAGAALRGEALLVAGRIAAATNADLLAPFAVSRLERGAGRPVVERLPYLRELARKRLAGLSHLILVGAAPPAAHFAYPECDAALTPADCNILTLASPGDDYAGALASLAVALAAARTPPVLEAARRPFLPSGNNSAPGLAAVVAALLPENAIVVDEGMTAGRAMIAATKGAPPHDWLGNTGGSIGIAMPLAIGAAIACPNRPVLCLSADGSGMYNLQALWTMARENLNITTVIFANGAYAIINDEYYYNIKRVPGRQARDLMEIDRPDLDWVALAKGMGVPGIRVESLEGLAQTLRAVLNSGGPSLIEVPL